MPESRHDAAATTGVVLALVSGTAANPVETLAVELRREVIDVSVCGFEALVAGAPHERAVVVLAFPTAVDPATCERAVRWADERRPRPGLIAWAPAAGAATAEVALAAGFDDAVVGPVSGRELAARVRAVHHRVHWQGRQHRLRHGPLTVDVDGHELWIDGARVSLTGTELAVLRALIRARGRALSRMDLLDLAWGASFEISERAVDNVVLRLRRKLPRPDLIETVRGVGFRLAADE